MDGMLIVDIKAFSLALYKIINFYLVALYVTVRKENLFSELLFVMLSHAFRKMELPTYHIAGHINVNFCFFFHSPSKNIRDVNAIHLLDILDQIHQIRIRELKCVAGFKPLGSHRI